MAQPQEFTRYIGYDSSDSFRSFLIGQFAAAKRDGLFFRERLPLPSTDEISAAAAYTAAGFDNPSAIKSGLDAWLRTVNVPCDSNAVAQIMAQAIPLCGANQKNTYFVLLCWVMKYLPIRAQRVLFIGSPTLRELYALYIFSVCGARVTLVSYGQDSDFDRFPLSGNVIVKSGGLTAPIQVDFDKVDLSKQAQLSQMYSECERVRGIVKRLDTTAAGMFEDILRDRKTRVIKNGGIYTEDGEIPVYSAALIGYDEEAVYNNMLVKFKESFAGLKKQLIFIEKPLENPDADEVRALGSVPRTSTAEMIDSLALLIKLSGDPTRTALAQNALRKLLRRLDTGNQTVLMNYGNKLITWLYRCTQARKYSVQYEDIPVILYYGDISQSEMYFLCFMSESGFDTVYITPNKKMLRTAMEKNPDGRMQIFELAQSKESESYPDKPMKMKMATVAYNAERDLDTMLYGGDTGIFRSFQFPNSQSVTLKTTYEEIGILWRQEARFRTGFSVSGNLVCVPNIFAKISGVADGNTNAYWEEIRSRLTPDTILRVKEKAAPIEKAWDLSVYRGFYRNGSIDTEKLKASTLNKYSFIPDRLQDMLFYKLQETASCGFLRLEGDELMCAVIHYGLGLGKDFLQLVQRFDFTRQVPKLVYIDTVEDTFGLEECVQIVLCSLIGFDVLIYTPTGYKNLETYIKSDAFEEHIMNQFIFDMDVPKLKIPSEEKSSGLFGRLFKKG